MSLRKVGRTTRGVGAAWWLPAVLAALLLVPVPSAAVADASTGAPVSVFPIPGSRLAMPQTQITFRGVSPFALGSVQVTGSVSGAHPGRIAGDSDGMGGSFLPDKPFTPGEVVTVTTGLSILGASGGTFSFTIQQPAGVVPPPVQRTAALRASGDVASFRSRPDLHPATVRVDQGHLSGEDIFITPMRGPVQWGPEIVDPSGRLVWFQPVSGAKAVAGDLRVQRYQGQPVLTWFEGYLNVGVGKGLDVIYDNHYRHIATVKAANGLAADVHAFTITPQNTALITAYHLVHWDASAMGGRTDTAVADSVVQEIDIPTGLVLFQWDSLDHVPVTASSFGTDKGNHPYDYFHVNSIQELGDGSLLVSARNTSTVYDIDHRTGAIIWELGGKHSNFKMGAGTATAFQHDAHSQGNGLFTIFDDGCCPQVHKQSRGIIERVDMATHTAKLVRELDHSPPLVSAFEGSVQLLPHGNAFVGWGSAPYFTEFGAKGRVMFDARFVDGNSSYRAYRFAWSAQPDTPPALAVRGGAREVSLYASWNGATDVARWQVLGGPSPSSLKPLKTVGKDGFETAIALRAGPAYFAVRALSRSGSVLASSGPTRSPHTSSGK